MKEWSDDDEMKRSFSLSAEADHRETRRKSITQDHRKPDMEEHQERRMSLVKEAHLAKSWIASSVQTPYWNPDSEKLVIKSTDYACKM